MWYFTSLYKKWRYGQTSFKLKNWTETMKSSCIDDILSDFDKFSKKFVHTSVRLKIKEKKDLVTGTCRNILGIEEPVHHPVFTQNEIARISSKRILYPVVFALLLLFEGLIYSLLANLITPRSLRDALPGITIVFGLGFAVVFIMALHFAFQYYFGYLEAKEIIETKGLDKKLLARFLVKRNLAIFVFSIFIITNLATAVIRAHILEPKGNNSQDYGTPLFIMSLGLTFIAAIAMGLIEHELFEKNEKYKVFKNWKWQNKQRKMYMTAIKDLYFNTGKIIGRYSELHWSVVLDYQRIFECRFDAEDQALYEEFQAKLAEGHIALNAIDGTVYSRFKPIQSAIEELFKYGIISDPQIKAHLAEIKSQVDEIATYENQKNEK
jgi:hypothetical protein